MEKMIFFGLVIPIMAFVLYLGGTAIMKGFSAKEANKLDKADEKDSNSDDFNFANEKNNLSDELSKLSDLHEKGVITQEEFDKAKNKLLNN
ncbi:SHOCT domain-containing protein [Candidatus Pelagibacter communis]|uniref:SHOCT domain-containing protein n=1 Tax=Pelagibacter ubique TaxID=198252 RepID=UPI00094D52BD|nr:SHOCT domain-containing protein [Candidatus Pelagibacter ubique]|tara:strand:+ start:1170 stop:1442 length:273 start_codon:yes stop_codon:yes gene_type:complete